VKTIPCSIASGIWLQVIEFARRLDAKTSGPSWDRQNSLLISLLAGNLRGRPVRSGLRPQPASLGPVPELWPLNCWPTQRRYRLYSDASLSSQVPPAMPWRRSRTFSTDTLFPTWRGSPVGRVRGMGCRTSRVGFRAFKPNAILRADPGSPANVGQRTTREKYR
jgi:hypothetical protein